MELNLKKGKIEFSANADELFGKKMAWNAGFVNFPKNLSFTGIQAYSLMGFFTVQGLYYLKTHCLYIYKIKL